MIARPIGDGGVSTISNAAGKNASSSRRRSTRRSGKETAFVLANLSGAGLADFMEPSLEAIERGVAAAGLDQLVVRAVLDDAAAFDGEDAGGHPERREAMGDHEHGAPASNRPHVLMH